MADTSFKVLNYGHPGEANYDLEDRQWAFARRVSNRKLTQVRTWDGKNLASTVATPPLVRFPILHTSANGTSIQKYAKGLTRSHPNLAAATEQFSETALLSAAIQTTTSTYDPLVGDLLSFGSTTLVDLHEDPRRIAASVAGETGNILRLAILTKERSSWATDRSVWVDGASLKEAHCGYWNEEAAPIRQTCFAESEERSSLLAVRLPRRTVLLRPTYHRRSLAAQKTPIYDLPPSTLDAHPILSLGIDETGGSPHAHVTFNPDFQLQLGVVDQTHSWGVWDIEHGRKGNMYTISCLVQGPIVPPEVDAQPGEDGWSRIMWIGDVNTILVCNRRYLSFIGIKGDTYTRLPCPLLFSKRSTDWILDVKRHPRLKGRVFVLTSTCLTLLAVTTASDALDATVGEVGATVLVSWRHYRGAEDFTLQINAQLLSDNGNTEPSILQAQLMI